MPYKSKEKQREAARQSMERKRQGTTGVNVVPSDVVPKAPVSVVPDVTPWEAQAWENVQAYISRPSPGMPNLERLQRIAGSLGKYAGEVRFGLDGLVMKDIGEVLGTQPMKYPR